MTRSARFPANNVRKLVCGLVLLGAGCADPEYNFPAPVNAWGLNNPAPPPVTTRTDRVLQVVEPTVDVLWVVDNSLSMEDDLKALARTFPKFVRPFEAAAIDWHIGVVTTDMDNAVYAGRLVEAEGVRYVDRDTRKAASLFAQMCTTLTASWTGYERGRDAVHMAMTLQDNATNYGFLRDNSSLHVTVVTDEDDDSTNVTRNEFVDWMSTLRSENRRSFNSIVAMVPEGYEERGQQYIDLSALLGGVVRDLNGGDWDTLLDELGVLQAPPPADEFFLSALPVPETLDVLVVHEGVTFAYVMDLDYAWDAVRNSVIFLQGPPPIGSAIEMTYVIAATDLE